MSVSSASRVRKAALPSSTDHALRKLESELTSSARKLPELGGFAPEQSADLDFDLPSGGAESSRAIRAAERVAKVSWFS